MKSVVICGSQRWKEEIRAFVDQLKKLGAPVVFAPNFDRRPKKFLRAKESRRLSSPAYRKQIPALVFQHFDRVRKADVCFVYNKEGYVGVNTTLEIGCAHGQDMIIYALEPELPVSKGGEICRDILFTDYVQTPEDLFKLLQ